MSFYVNGQKEIIKGMYSSKYDDILNASAEFIEKEIAPSAAKIDKEKVSPKENLEKLARQGMLASHFPEKYGALALPYPVHIAILEMVSKACASTGVSMAIHNTCCEGFRLYGTKRQKEKYLTSLIGTGNIAAFCLTETSGGTNIFTDILQRLKFVGFVLESLSFIALLL